MRRGDTDFFASLSRQQSPDYLWIGCADSRVRSPRRFQWCDLGGFYQSRFPPFILYWRLAPPLAVMQLLGDDIGHDADLNPTPDIITGFENATGGSRRRLSLWFIGAERADGPGNGMDILEGLGGRDVLTGGGNPDTFRFIKPDRQRSHRLDARRDHGFPAVTSTHSTSVNIDANKKTAANDAFVLTGHHGLDSFSHTPGQLRYAFEGKRNDCVWRCER